LEREGKYLYQYDLDSQLSGDARKELEKLSDIADIIIL
jgi:L-serine dehydratase